MQSHTEDFGLSAYNGHTAACAEGADAGGGYSDIQLSVSSTGGSCYQLHVSSFPKGANESLEIKWSFKDYACFLKEKLVFSFVI